MTESRVAEEHGLESLVGRLADEFLGRQEAGDQPDIEEYVARCPHAGDLLRKVLASLQLLGASLAGGEPTPTGGDAPPGTLGDFRIISEVGRGGMGIVYEAEQISLGRRVALKALPFAATMDPRQLQRFHNEARAAAGLHHTNIVPVYAVGQERGVHYYAMQFIEGRTLAEWIDERRGAALSPVPTRSEPGAAAATTACVAAQATSAAYFRQVAEWGVQAAEALDYAHTLGVVHRDVKPANLLVDAAGRLWITDFGLAQVQSDTRLTLTGDLVGTLRYMSPEQALAKRVVIDHRTDVYSLGATLYELLALEPAFGGQDRQELLRQIAFEEPRALRRTCKAIPADLETVVLKALEKNPHDRYTTSQELADDLRRFLEEKPIQARRPSWRQVAVKWARRHRAAVTAATLCLLVTLASLIGSAGWVMGDRAARQREAESKVREALQAAEPGLRRGNPWDPGLIAAMERARAQIDGAPVSQDLRRQVERLEKEVHILAELERIRLDRTGLRDNRFDRGGSDRQYAEAFRELGIDVETLSFQEVVALVSGSAIRPHLVAGLDDWAQTLAYSAGTERNSQKEKKLLAVARQVDPDPWRNRLRDVTLPDNSRDLERLARSAPIEELPAATVGQLGVLLAEGATDVSSPMVECLRRAQQRFPADFWINHHLAVALRRIEPPQLEEAIGFYRAAIALRPESPGVHLNLGVALSDEGRLDEAMAEYRNAVRLNKDYAVPHINMGAVLYKTGRLDEAIEELREAIRLKEDYADAHNHLGVALREKGQLNEAIAEYREAIRLKKGYPDPHSNLGRALHDKGQLDEAIAECREAIRLKKDFAEAHHNLADALSDKGRADEAIAEYREAIRLKKNFAQAHGNLAIALHAKGRLDEAIEEYRQAIHFKKDEGPAHYNLGCALAERGRLDEAIAEYREAIRLKHDFAKAHGNLGSALGYKGRLDEAIAEFREVIRLNQDDVVAHYNLGGVLREKGRLGEAIAEYREAIRLKKDYVGAHVNLGVALRDYGRVDEAIAEHREAIRLKSDCAEAHNNLGVALRDKRRLDEAVAECRQAIRLKSDYAEAYCNLGHTLRDQGEFADALAALKRGHELGSRNTRSWPYPTAQWIRNCERLLALDRKLPSILNGRQEPADVGERIALATLCQMPCKRRYVAALRFYEQAFAAEPKLTGVQPSKSRYNAACAAALAGCGQGVDADKLDAPQRERLRRQARDWLRADLAAWRRVLEKESDKARPVVVQNLQHWQEDSDFAGVRGDGLATLPTAERQAWQQLWADVAVTLARAKKQTTTGTQGNDRNRSKQSETRPEQQSNGAR